MRSANLRLVLLVSLLTAACAPSDGTVSLPTVPYGGCRDIGLVDAILAGDPSDPAVAWLTINGERRDVFFPDGYRAKFAPDLEVVNASGTVVAQAGDQVAGACVIGQDGRDWLILWSPAPSS